MSGMNLPITVEVLDSLNDGLYVTDTERRILYWNKSAERITGWRAAEVVGHRCMDNILNHEDKDQHRLCTTELCPLHRCMVTDKASTSPVIIFAQTKAGGRIPLSVSVAPLHDADGQVIGAVENFQDFSDAYADLERAKLIQTQSLEQDLPKDSRLAFSSFYLPHDMIGGDFFSIRQLDVDRYGFILADVMGHGVAAALHTMHLSSLWNRYCGTLTQPSRFARLINRNLCKIVRDESFATAICGVLDAARRTVRITAAGGPALVHMRGDGDTVQVSSPGIPFGMIENADYDDVEFGCEPGDSLLMFTDGAVEISNAAGRMLGIEGLVGIITSLGYPDQRIGAEPLEEALLKYSNGIRMDDDLTLLEIRFL